MKVIFFSLAFFFASESVAYPLYRVEKDGKTNWLLGTLHPPIRRDQIPSELIEIIKNARTVLIEADEQTRRRLEIAQQEWAKNAGRLRNLKRQLGMVRFLSLRNSLSKIGFPVDQLDYAPVPYFVDFSIATSLRQIEEKIYIDRINNMPPTQRETILQTAKAWLERLNFSYTTDPMSGLNEFDFELINVAEQNHKPLVSLENADVALTALKAAPESLAIKAIRNHFRRNQLRREMPPERLIAFEVYRSIYAPDNLVRSYLRWAPGHTLPIIPYDFDELEPLALRELTDRHKYWVGRIYEEFAQGNTIVMVGDAHVSGDQRLPEVKPLTDIFREAGYTVTFAGPYSCAQALYKSTQ